MQHGFPSACSGRFERVSRTVSVAVLVALSISGSRARADVVTLDALVAHARAEHPSLRAREARVRAAEARVDAVRAEMQPRLSFDVGVVANPGAIVKTDCP